MKENDINLLLKKADELRALFILGQRVIPFLEEIFLFFRDIQPLLDEINVSFAENLKKMPGASEQLSKVTEANEMATTEIMDIVDGLFYKADVISTNVNNLKAQVESLKENPIKLLQIIYKGIESGKDMKSALPQIKNAIDSLRAYKKNEINEIANENENIINSLRNDASAIMMALQVQDITSQQIASVNHMLGTIQTKLMSILQHFSSTEINDLVHSGSKDHDETVNVSKLHREIAFDPHAMDSIKFKDSRQNNVDEMIKEHHETTSVPASQDDIDALFNSGFEFEQEIAEEVNESPKLVEEDLHVQEEVVMEEVNTANNLQENQQSQNGMSDSDEHLLNKLKDIELSATESFSQDDIDALFGTI